MCIRDRSTSLEMWIFHCPISNQLQEQMGPEPVRLTQSKACLLYTSDAADERSSVDLGGRRIIKKKNKHTQTRTRSTIQTTQQITPHQHYTTTEHTLKEHVS